MRKIIIILVFSFFIYWLAFCETIVLKSGSKREGKIIEKTNEYVVINYGGAPLKYYYDEIESIDGAKIIAPGGYSAPRRYSEKGPEDIFQEASAAIVYITAEGVDVNSGAIGSGFVVHPEGVIATNYHVVKDATNASVRFSDGKTYPVVGIIYDDPNLDVCLLKINARNLPMLTLGDSNVLKIGEPLYCIGNPLGLDFSFSNGILAGIRNLNDIKWLQFTAPISPGNSGGPILNARGEILGVVTWQFTEGQNLNFAWAINQIKPHISTKVTKSFQEFAKTAQDSQEIASLLKNFEGFVERRRIAAEKARFYFPRYLLDLSLHIYEQQDKETAVKLAESTKTLLEIFLKYLVNYEIIFDTRYSEELQIPQLKQKAISYLENMVDAADAVYNYYRTGQTTYYEQADSYVWKASQYDKDIEKIIGEPLKVNLPDKIIEVISLTNAFSTSSFNYHADLAKKIYGDYSGSENLKCEECAKIMQCAKDVYRISAKYITHEDKYLESAIKEWINISLELFESYQLLYQTAEPKFAESAEVFENKLSELDEQMVQYLAQKEASGKK
jgi:hypothetical protein